LGTKFKTLGIDNTSPDGNSEYVVTIEALKIVPGG
jgi:hypothetical protein